MSDGEDDIDWQLTTWNGSRREELRRWAALPLERMIAALEEMEEFSNALREPGAKAVSDSNANRTE